MKRSTDPDLLHAIVNMSAMVFAAIPPEDALQSLADALDVQTVAIGRIHKMTGEKQILVQNANASVVAAEWSVTAPTAFNHNVVLHDTSDHCDTLIIQTRRTEINDGQRRAMDGQQAYLATLWASRSDSFNRVISIGRTLATQSALHPDNPYALTPTEFRVCGLIAAGHRPATMAHTMNTSISTTRTHLRSIYTKTGLDGMMGVVRNLHIGLDDKKVAS